MEAPGRASRVRMVHVALTIRRVPRGPAASARLRSGGIDEASVDRFAERLDPDVPELNEAGRTGVLAVPVAAVVLQGDRPLLREPGKLGVLDHGRAVEDHRQA